MLCFRIKYFVFQRNTNNKKYTKINYSNAIITSRIHLFCHVTYQAWCFTVNWGDIFDLICNIYERNE